MPTLEDQEYPALMKRGNDAERTAQVCWTAGTLTAAVMLSWGISAKSPGVMIPVVLAIAAGFYARLRGTQQARWIAGYVEEFCEEAKGPQWFTRLRRLEGQPGYRTLSEWADASLANAGVVLAVILAWIYAGPAPRGDLLAGIATGCGVLFGFHSVAETVRMSQTNWSGMWQKVSGELKEAPRTARAVNW